MKSEEILAARKAAEAAEAAVEGLSNGPRKTAAYQTILAHFLRLELGRGRSEADGKPPAKAPTKERAAEARGNGTTARLLSLVQEGLFCQQRSLAEIRQTLSEKGWHYKLEDLGTPVTRLVRRKYLRRTQVMDGGKTVWKYSNY
jgi:hypothetical protein